MKKEGEETVDVVMFDDDALPLVVELLGNEITEDGEIIDATSKENISDEFSGEKLNTKNFGGVLASSRLYIAKSDASLAEYITRYSKHKWP